MRLRVLLGVLLLACGLPLQAEARQRAYGWCEQGSSVSVTSLTPPFTLAKVQRSFPSCTITVYLTGTFTKATIYANNSGTLKANPFTADATGYWFWYADNGQYDVTLSGGGIPTPFTLGDITLGGSSGVNGSGGAFPLGGATLIGVSDSARTEAPDTLDVLLDGSQLGTLVPTVYVRLKTDNVGTSVQAVLYDVTDAAVVGSSAVSTATTFTDYSFTVTLNNAGPKVYRLQLVPGNASAFVYGIGYVQLAIP